jgi:hypothetical protein
MLQAILADLEAARCRAAARWRWGLGTGVCGGNGEQGLQGINATIARRSSHPRLAEVSIAWAQPYPSISGGLTSAIKVRKNWNRARLVGVGLSWTRPESSAA